MRENVVGQGDYFSQLTDCTFNQFKVTRNKTQMLPHCSVLSTPSLLKQVIVRDMLKCHIPEKACASALCSPRNCKYRHLPTSAAKRRDEWLGD